MTAPRYGLLLALCLAAAALCLVRGGDTDPEAPVAPNFDPPDIPVLHSFRIPGGVWQAGFSADGRVLYTYSTEDGTDGPRLWDVESGKPLDRFDPSVGLRQVDFPTRLYVHTALSPDGRMVAVDTDAAPTRNDSYVLLLDAGSGKLFHKFSCYRGASWLAFSPDGTALAVGQGNAEGIVKCWNIARERAIWESPAHAPLDRSNDTLWGAFAPDGKTVAAEFEDGSVRLFDAALGQETVLQPTPDNNIQGQHHRLAYSPDGRFLATMRNRGNEVRVWNVGSRKLAHLVSLNPLPVPYSFHLLHSRHGLVAASFAGEALGFSPDGRTLLVWGSGDRVRLFEVASGKLRREFMFKSGIAVGFSPAATAAALATDGGAIYLCDWRADGRSRPARMTPVEAERLWDELASDDGEAAWQAVLALAAAPQQAAKTLGSHLPRWKPVPAQDLERLSAQLDSDLYEEREEATRRLAALGQAAGPTLRRALANQASPEMRRRAEELLTKLERPPGLDELRKMRGVEALEYAGSAEARAIFKNWASGAEGTLLTEEAGAALRRLELKPPDTNP